MYSESASCRRFGSKNVCNRPLRALVPVFLRNSWRGPGDLHDLVQVLMRRSCGDPVEIFFKRSLHQDLENVLHGCFYESSSGMLIGNSCMKTVWSPLHKFLKIYIEGPPAVATMSNLMCYCSITILACIWYIDFLPALFGAPCWCN
jgi:hypothetical protein